MPFPCADTGDRYDRDPSWLSDGTDELLHIFAAHRFQRTSIADKELRHRTAIKRRLPPFERTSRNQHTLCLNVREPDSAWSLNQV